jgi:hypothetical protein
MTTAVSGADADAVRPELELSRVQAALRLAGTPFSALCAQGRA